MLALVTFHTRTPDTGSRYEPPAAIPPTFNALYALTFGACPVAIGSCVRSGTAPAGGGVVAVTVTALVSALVPPCCTAITS